MGINNRQRRAAKKRRRAAPRERTPGGGPFIPLVTPEFARSHLLQALARVDDDPRAAGLLAVNLLRPDALVPPSVMRQALQDLLAELTAAVVGHGWRPSDLVQAVTRRLSEAQVPPLLALVADETERHPAGRVADAWREDLSAAGAPESVDLRRPAGVQAALELAACLATLPPISTLLPPPGAAARDSRSADGGDPKLLAKVRALLAKAESTEFDEEAEALSAKAQELISRHALDRLLVEGDSQPQDAVPVARRIWIDAPYVFAKSLLVHAVADANRCRSVLSEKIGFCTVLGRESDLVAVDVLVTSLLLQAGAAMRRHGRQTDLSGTSRTKSFRQSFLISYASRISERLHAAADEAVQSTGRAGELVPVLHRHAERLDAATEQMFPQLVTREAAIGNAKGWAAGRAAADQALLDTDLQITRAAS